MNANPPWHLEPRVRRTARHRGFEYRPDIHGLRAIAIIAVVVFHALPTLMPGGFIGVDIFFVISGYLIAGIVFEEIDSGTFRIARFYQRRVLRLFPALTLVFATSLLAGSFILLDTEYFQLAEHMLAVAFGFANITLWYETGYFELQSKATPLLHLWSLGVEEQFYLVLPFTLIVLTKRRGALLRILILMCVLSFILCADLFNLFDTSTKFFLPPFRAWELLAGVILAYGQRSSSIENKSSAPEKFRDTIATLGVAALLCSLIVLNSANFSAFGALLPVFWSLAFDLCWPTGVGKSQSARKQVRRAHRFN